MQIKSQQLPFLDIPDNLTDSESKQKWHPQNICPSFKFIVRICMFKKSDHEVIQCEAPVPLHKRVQGDSNPLHTVPSSSLAYRLVFYGFHICEHVYNVLL